MKLADPLTTLFSHNLWANLRLLERCAVLTDEQLGTSLIGTYGSIRETLEHMVASERSYFARVSTGRPYRHPEDAPPLTLAEMREWMEASGGGFVEWAAKVAADDMVEVDWGGTLRMVPKSIFLTQAINHATEHRAQIMAILTQLGIEPPELDGWQYFDEVYR